MGCWTVLVAVATSSLLCCTAAPTGSSLLESVHSTFLAGSGIALRTSNGTKVERDNEGIMTTADLSRKDMRWRKVLYSSIIAASAGLLLLLGMVAFLRRTRQAEENRKKEEEKVPKGLAYQPVVAEKPEQAELGFSGGGGGAGLGALDADEMAEEQLETLKPEELEDKRTEWAQKQAKKLRSEHPCYLRIRRMAIISLFIAYVATSIGLPVLHAQETTCARGAFWEVHMQFLAVFVVTKAMELWLCASDPTLEWGSMSIFTFFSRFPPSFLGYLDGYTDASGVVIAHTCANPLAQQLSVIMAAAFLIGVVVLQWIVLPILATRDPSDACLLKLLHMDLLTSVITLPAEQKWLWNAIAMVRTFAEDIPQAALQIAYLVFVQGNLFMAVSVIMAIGSSLKALYDARSRFLESAAAREAFEKRKRSLELYSCSQDGTIRVWDTSSGECRRVLDAGSPANQIAATCGNLYSAHDDGWIREWNLATGEITRQLKHIGGNGRVVATSDKLYTTTCTGREDMENEDFTTKEWSLKSGECTREFRSSSLQGMAFARGGKLYNVAPDGHGRNIAEWDLDAPDSPPRIFRGHQRVINSIVATKQRLLTGSRDGTVKEWSLSNGRCTRTFNDHGECSWANPAHSGLHIAVGLLYSPSHSKPAINAWSLETGDLVRQLEGHTAPVLGMATVNGKLYSCSEDCSINEWDMNSGRCLRTFEGHTKTVFMLIAQYCED